MSSDKQPLWNKLVNAKLVQGPPPKMEEPESPWYIKLLLALSGWIASLFLLGFVAVAFSDIFENSFTSFIAGGLMIAGAFAILQIPKNEFLQHLMLAVSLAGQALMVWGIAVDSTQDNLVYVWGLITVMQLLLAILMPDFVHRVWSAFAAAIAFSMTMQLLQLPYLNNCIILFLACWLVLNEFHFPEQIRKFQAISYGLILALIPLKGSALFPSQSFSWLIGSSETIDPPWLDELFLALTMFYLVFKLLQRFSKPMFTVFSISTLFTTLLLCVLSMQAQGISVAMAIMLLGFSVSNRILLGLGICSLLFYISTYYYQMQTSLLDKSITLVIIGSVLLIVRYLILRALKHQQEVAHVS